MLDAETKRRIDTARDILVGKVPDPKSQVEQITIALIYKFMDDLDAESEEWGGERTFFAGEFAKYGWAKLTGPGVGGHEALNRYAEAITRMPENPGIPPLFRSIFSNAYLPYRDPETLRAFLKVIDQFTYDHSERLGDAFEYLLSVLDVQGDAGQFRTPRHIIDFIVAVMDPKKDETVLDPACGTAGFLISSYKHILAANTNGDGQSTLTTDDRGRLADNFKGYDISPDYVRLSLVNMYLHGFRRPNIHEYDTLTSEERWDEYADVILANPPFMSPKGGIRPHNRFSVKSKRSEVLFVDYMAEHLAANGRAGIIVPEGIIFQSQKAYKQLRKMLVEECLVAVVSLPAGVFNPYSGVKTSVLILDRALARRTNAIAFFKVENDGFHLGAQRRPIELNDLPRVQAELGEYLGLLRAGDSVDHVRPTLGGVVNRQEIAASGEYNFRWEMYREDETPDNQWKTVTIGQVCRINPDSGDPKELYTGTYFNYIDISCVENGTGRLLGANRVEAHVAPSRARRLVEPGDVLISTVRPNLRAFAVLSDVPERTIASTGFAVLRPQPHLLLSEFLIRLIRDDPAVEQMTNMMGKGSYPSINQRDVAAIKILLPPLDVQREIVEEIEGYQKVIDGARAVVENYRPHVAVDPAWPLVQLRDACELIADGTHFSPKSAEQGARLYITSKNVRENHLDLSHVSYVSEQDHRVIYKSCPAKKGDVLYVKDGANTGLAALNTLDDEFSLLSSVAVLRGKPNCLDNRFLSFFLNTVDGRRRMLSMVAGVAITRLTLSKINHAEIPLPPLATQQAIVAQIETEQSLVESNRELVDRFQRKIRAAMSRVWGHEAVM